MVSPPARVHNKERSEIMAATILYIKDTAARAKDRNVIITLILKATASIANIKTMAIKTDVMISSTIKA